MASVNVVPADDGLHYTVILPSPEEWTYMFAPNSSSSNPPYSALHLWLKCVDATLRGYLFIDAVADGEDVSLSRDREQALVRAFDRRVLVDGTPVLLQMSMAGGEFFVHLENARKRNHYAEVHVSVRGWRRYAKFPVHACAAAPPPSPETNHRPDYIFHSYTMESSFIGADTDAALPAMAQVRTVCLGKGR